MEYTDENFYMLVLSFLEGLTAYQKLKILEEKGSAEAVFMESVKPKPLMNISHQQLQNVIKLADKECELMAKNNIRTIFAGNKEFSFRLRNCPDYPLVLFYKGKTDVNRRYALSIVGSRKADKRGEKHVCELLDYLAPYKNDLVLITGIATGIDATVLSYARRLGFYTVSILPKGFGHLHDRDVEKRISSASCVFTENRFDFGYTDRIYEQRNRIIVGMSDAVVVAQAKSGKGSGLYVEKALDYNRDCFAYLYPEETIMTEKCNLFVERDLAIPLNSTEDFFEKMIWPWR